MTRYYIMSGAQQEKPGSGDIEKQFDAQSDEDAFEMACRHYEGTGYSLWSRNGTDKLGLIKFKFIQWIK